MTSSILFFTAALFLAVATGLLRSASLRPGVPAPRVPERTSLELVPGAGAADGHADLGRAA